MNILLLTTGGTIDSAPYPENAPPPVDCIPTTDYLSVSTLREIASASGSAMTVDWIELCNKDSKYLDQQDLSAVEHAIISKAADYERIIVTVGTDRMTDIAQDLKARLGDAPDCPVVYTGAVVPLSNGDTSDGRDNLRLALLGEPTVAPGVYIAMHGLFAPCEHLRKDFETRRFVYR